MKGESEVVQLNNIVAKDGYLVDGSTGEKVVFYECDPKKNTECSKTMCRVEEAESEASFGLCAKTPDPRFRKDGGRAFYAVLKEDTYWGREYIE